MSEYTKEEEAFFRDVAMTTDKADKKCFYVGLDEWDDNLILMKQLAKRFDYRFGQASAYNNKKEWMKNTASQE